MPKKRLSLILGFSALLSGFLIYVLFRGETYIAKMFYWLPFLAELQAVLKESPNAVIKYYVPDFLWAFSLFCFLYVAYPTGKWRLKLCAAVTFMAGALWEALQFWGVFAGTGDILDITAYFVACLLAIIILKERKL